MSDDPIKVLLVEDNPGDARLIWEMLTDVETTGPVASAFDLECTDRLSTGLEHLAAGDIDVVLLDLSLPDSGGLGTFAKVHAQAPQVPTIVLTGLDDESLAVEAVREGAQDYLVKGQVDSHLLVRAMRYAIERKRRNEELAALNAIATTVSQSLDLEQILDAALEKTLAVLNIEGGLIYLLDEISQTFAPAVHRGVSKDVLREVARLRKGEGLSGYVAETGEPLVVADIGADPRTISPTSIREGWHSYAGIPIKCKEKVLGMMALGTRQEGYFKPDHVNLLIHIGNQIGVAVENARLYEKVTERMIEATLLHKVSNTLMRTLNLERLLENILEVLQKAFGYSHCAILLPDKETGELYVKAARGYLQAAGEGLRIKIGQEGITGWVAANRVPLNVPDVTQDDRYRKWVEGTKSEIAVPMLAGEQVVGVLDVQSTEVNAFDEDDLRTLSSVAAQAAIAIERARLFQEARELDRMKSDFVSNVSHELRTPLANIKLYAALAQKGHPEKRQHYLGIIEGETERLETLIEDILDLSRLERGAVKLQIEPLPLAEIVQQVVGAHLATAEVKDVELSWQVPDGLPTLYADRTQLLLMLNNLLGNALQYTPCGGSVWVEARAGKELGRPTLYIAVRDTGIGIPADEHERIFERFYRGRHTPVGAVGTGLGLTIVKESMALHGGEVMVESVVGQGSTFTLCFPLRRR